MTFKILWNMIKRDFVIQRHVIIPFIIAVSIMFGKEYILLSLTTNIYLSQHNPELKISAIIGIIFMTILTFIFVIYANNFVINHKKKEFALNMILGMEKKHIRLIIFIELAIQFSISAVLSIVGGYLFGELFFMILNKLINARYSHLSAYPFDILSMTITLIMLFTLMLLLFIISNFKITFKKSLQLIRRGKETERHTSNNVLSTLLIVSILLTALGYYLALKPNTAIGSIGILFIAILATFIGTYLLFISLGTMILTALQRINHFYYKPNNFFFIAGLNSRVKSSAIGLATISLICTFLLVTFSMTVTTYRDMDERFDQAFKNDFTGYYNGDFHHNKKLKQKIIELKRDIHKKVPTDQFKVFTQGIINAELQGGAYHKVLEKQTVSNNLFNFSSGQRLNTFISIYNKEDYNQFNKKIRLADNEVAMSTHVSLFKKIETLKIFSKTYHVKYIDDSLTDNIMYVDGINLIVKNQQQMNQLVDYFANNKYEDVISTPKNIKTTVEFNVLNEKDKSNNYIAKVGQQHDIGLQAKKDYLTIWKQINSSLVFVGSIVSLVLLIGVFLMMYYKQVSEGYEDREEYQVMKKVGLDEALIKKTINKQVVWVFLIPVIVAIIHTLVASRIIYAVLGIIGQYNLGLFVSSYMGVIVTFIVIYSLMYWVTSRIYYMMINSRR
ncbi:FtsX-like permease family protein [Staphylococcus saccharolyticus]|uniref:FtsX-like permease family protein n=1 Tax=Staphylococcus saccharolyticus TaxID=33028 RepID=UPI0032E0460E